MDVPATSYQSAIRNPQSAIPRRGLGLAEAAVSTVIVGVMLVAALNAVAASRTGASRIGERARGAMLAQALANEILQCAYEDAVAGSLTLGPDIGETGGDRTAFDDVDDYHGWTESPPENRDGSIIAGHDGWGRHVAVEFADLSDVSRAALADSGVKRIIVTVKYQDRVTAVWTALRCSQTPPTLKVGGALVID